MARKSRMAVLKRQREHRKAEKAATKRERREQRQADSQDDSPGDEVASQDDLESYGFIPPPGGESGDR